MWRGRLQHVVRVGKQHETKDRAAWHVPAGPSPSSTMERQIVSPIPTRVAETSWSDILPSACRMTSARYFRRLACTQNPRWSAMLYASYQTGGQESQTCNHPLLGLCSLAYSCSTVVSRGEAVRTDNRVARSQHIVRVRRQRERKGRPAGDVRARR